MCHLCDERSYDGNRRVAAPAAPVAKPEAAPQKQPAPQVGK